MTALIEKLSLIQQEIKAPKNLYNTFGKYKYRNAEGILEAVKPFEAKYKVAFILSDEIVQVGERYYVKATASINNTEDKMGSIEVTAYAREAEEKKGMDDSQITGTASSYARKYALNGLLLLDDTKDADTDEYHAQTVKKDSLSPAQVKTLENLLAAHKKTVKGACDYYKVKRLEDLSIEQFKELMDMMGANKPGRKSDPDKDLAVFGLPDDLGDQR